MTDNDTTRRAEDTWEADVASGTKHVRKKRRKWLRRFLWLVVVCLLLAVVAVSSVPAVLSSDWFRGFVSAKASSAFGQPVGIDRVDFGWGGRFGLEGVRVDAASGDEAERLLWVDRVAARWSWRPLLSGKLALDDLRIEGVRVRVVRRADGLMNLPKSPEEQERSGAGEGEKRPAAPVPTELPLERLHVSLKDCWVEFVDQETPLPPDSGRPFRAGFRMASLRVDLDDPKAPFKVGCDAVLALGDEATSAPVAFSLTWTPGPRGHLDWTGARLDARGSAIGAEGRLSVAPTEGEPGARVEASGSLAPGRVERFASRAFGMAPPAGASGEIEFSLNGEWRDGKSPQARLRVASKDLAVAPPRLGGKRVGCEVLVSAAASGPAAPFGSVAKGAGWVAHPVVRLRVPSLDLAASADVRTTDKPKAPRGTARVALSHRPMELRPYLEPLGLVLPPDVDRVRRLDYAVEAEADPASSVTLVGRAMVELAPPTWRELQGEDVATTALLYLGVRHSVRYEPEADRAVLSLAASLDDGPGVKADPFLTESATVSSVFGASSRVESETTLHVAPLVAPLLRSGVAPRAFRTSGTLTVKAGVRRAAGGAVRGETMLLGEISAALLAFGELVPESLAQSLRPVGLRVDGLQVTADVDPAAGRVAVSQKGAARLTGGWRGEIGDGGAFDASLVLPLEWTGRTMLPGDGSVSGDVACGLHPHVKLAGAYSLDRSDAVALSFSGGVSPGGAQMEARDVRLSVGDWLRAEASAEAREAGREAICGSCDVSVAWGDALMAWVSPELLERIGGVGVKGRTQLQIDADGCFDPSRPESALAIRSRLTQRLDRLAVGVVGSELAMIAGLDMDVTTSASVRGDRTVLAPEATVRLRSDGVDALGLVGLRGVELDGAFDGDPAGLRGGWDVRLVLTDVAAAGELPVRLGPVRLATKGRVDGAAPFLEFDRFTMDVDAPGHSEPLARVDAACRVTSPAGPFRVRADVSVPALRAAGEWLEALAERTSDPTSLTLLAHDAAMAIREVVSTLPTVEGAAEVHVEGEGTAPTLADLEARRLPLRLTCGVELRDVSTTLTAPTPVMVRGLGNQFRLAIDGSNVALDAKGGLRDASWAGAPPIRLGPADWGGRLRVDAAKASAVWEGWMFEAPDWGLTLRLDGSADQWGRLANPRGLGGLPEPIREALSAAGVADLGAAAPYAEAARSVGFRNHARLEWRSGEWLTLPVGGLRFRGDARLGLEVLQEPGREVRTDWAAEFRDASLETEALAVRDLDGALRMLIAGQRRPDRRRTPGYASRLVLPFGDGFEAGPTGDPRRILTPPRSEENSDLRIGEVSLTPWVLRDIAVVSRGDLRDWLLQLTCGDLMGGRMEAQLRLREREGGGDARDWTISIDGAFTGVSAPSAIAAWRRLSPEETELDGVFQLRWEVDRSAKTPLELLRGVEVRLTITRVGKRALQGFLLAMDPDGRNPSLVSGRQALRYGRPDSVHFVFQHGLMNLRVRLVTVARSWDMTLLDRAPVGEATSLDALRPQLEALRWMRVGLDLLSGLDQWASGPVASRSGDGTTEIAGANRPGETGE